jgi:hypothetical protein
VEGKYVGHRKTKWDVKVETIVVVSLLYTNSAGEQSNLRGLRTGSISSARQRGDLLWMDLGREEGNIRYLARRSKSVQSL